MDQNRKLALAIILIFPVLLIAYIFGYYGKIEIALENEISDFQIEPAKGKTKTCDHNPCIFSYRPGRNLKGRVMAPEYLPQDFEIKTRFLKTKKITLRLRRAPTIKKYSAETFSRLHQEQKKRFATGHNFGPVLTDPTGKFAIFARRSEDDSTIPSLYLYVTDDQGSKKLLTIIRDHFSPAIFRKTFRLQKNGIILGSDNAIYFYDFGNAKKRKIFSGDPENFEQISVGDGNRFVTKIVDIWRYYDKEGKPQMLPAGVLSARFFGTELWTVSGNHIFINGKKLFSLDTDIERFKSAWFEEKNLYLEGPEEVWEISFPSYY